MGALVSKEHLEKVKGYVDIARKDGATIRCGDGVDELKLPVENEKASFHFDETNVVSVAAVCLNK